MGCQSSSALPCFEIQCDQSLGDDYLGAIVHAQVPGPAGVLLNGTLPDYMRPKYQSWEKSAENIIDVEQLEKTKVRKLKVGNSSFSHWYQLNGTSKFVKVAHCDIADSWKIESKDTKKYTQGGGVSLGVSADSEGVKGSLAASIESAMEGGDAKIVFEMTLPMVTKKLDLGKALKDSQCLDGKSIVYEVVLGARVVGEVDLTADALTFGAGFAIKDLEITPTKLNVAVDAGGKNVSGAVHKHNVKLQQFGGPDIQNPTPTTPIEDTISFLQGRWRSALIKNPDTWRPIFLHVSEELSFVAQHSAKTEIMTGETEPSEKMPSGTGNMGGNSAEDAEAWEVALKKQNAEKMEDLGEAFNHKLKMQQELRMQQSDLADSKLQKDREKYESQFEKVTGDMKERFGEEHNKLQDANEKKLARTSEATQILLEKQEQQKLSDCAKKDAEKEQLKDKFNTKMTVKDEQNQKEMDKKEQQRLADLARNHADQEQLTGKFKTEMAAKEEQNQKEKDKKEQQRLADLARNQADQEKLTGKFKTEMAAKEEQHQREKDNKEQQRIAELARKNAEIASTQQRRQEDLARKEEEKLKMQALNEKRLADKEADKEKQLAAKEAKAQEIIARKEAEFARKEDEKQRQLERKQKELSDKEQQRLNDIAKKEEEKQALEEKKEAEKQQIEERRQADVAKKELEKQELEMKRQDDLDRQEEKNRQEMERREEQQRIQTEQQEERTQKELDRREAQQTQQETKHEAELKKQGEQREKEVQKLEDRNTKTIETKEMEKEHLQDRNRKSLESKDKERETQVAAKERQRVADVQRLQESKSQAARDANERLQKEVKAREDKVIEANARRDREVGQKKEEIRGLAQNVRQTERALENANNKLLSLNVGGVKISLPSLW